MYVCAVGYTLGSIVITPGLVQTIATSTYSAAIYIFQSSSGVTASLMLKTMAEMQQVIVLQSMMLESIINATNAEFSATNCSFTMPIEAGICRMNFPNGILD